MNCKILTLNYIIYKLLYILIDMLFTLTNSFKINGYFSILWTGFISMEPMLKHDTCACIVSIPLCSNLEISWVASYFSINCSALSWFTQYSVYAAFMVSACCKKQLQNGKNEHILYILLYSIFQKYLKIFTSTYQDTYLPIFSSRTEYFLFSPLL